MCEGGRATEEDEDEAEPREGAAGGRNVEARAEDEDEDAFVGRMLPCDCVRRCRVVGISSRLLFIFSPRDDLSFFFLLFQKEIAFPTHFRSQLHDESPKRFLNSFSKTSTVFLSKFVNRTSFTLHHSHTTATPQPFTHSVLYQTVKLLGKRKLSAIKKTKRTRIWGWT
jgi:hypothetical protein